MAVTTEGLEYMPLDGRLGSAAMDGSNVTGATPEGVRSGDRAALQAVVERRGPAVIAFCTQVCGPHDATRAGAEAFARFRAAVRDAPDLTGLDPEVLLRGATRHAAASMARVPVGPPPHGKLRSRGTQTCEHVPTMLAARANGALGERDLERLARHLDRCERCDAMAEIFHRAELGYQDPPFDTLGTDTSSVLLDALEAVPMQTIGTAPAPSAGAPAGEALEGAFGHLPDLEDEVPIVVVAAPEPEPVVEELEATQPGEDVEEPEAEAEADGEEPAAVAVEHVDEPAEELEPEALAAEPLPEAAPETDELGETMEWDSVVPLPEDVDAMPVAAPLEGGRERRSGRGALVALPMLVIAAAVAGALFLAGVFGGNDATPPQVGTRPPVAVQKPVLTPLPVTVAKPAPSAAADPSASATAPATPTTPEGTTLP
jgi:hypothetical protein